MAPSSCQEVQIYGDGEYFLSLETNIFARIYCHNMLSSPLEYIKLEVGISSNYAQRWDNDASTCGASIKTGKSEFNKIRLIITVFKMYFISMIDYNMCATFISIGRSIYCVDYDYLYFY